MLSSTRALGAAGFAYAALAALPLLVAAVGHERVGRGFTVELAVGLGFVGFAMLALQFALTAKFRRLSIVLGLDALLHLHRWMGVVASALILGHVAILVAVDPAYAGFLDPRVDAIRALALWALLGALLLLMVTTLARTQLGIPYEWWRIGHGLLALAILGVGLTHILRVGWYVDELWQQAVWVATAVAAAGLVGYARAWKPMRLRSRPWRVADVRPETSEAWTVQLDPEGHEGMRFRAGQFVWLALGSSPFTIDQHPFSVSSAATRTRPIELTIKALGDHTARIGQLPPGTPAYLDGPYGSFVLDDRIRQAVFLVGGVGITPVMSILRTLRDTGRTLPTQLLYGVPQASEALFLDELERMAEAAWLELVPVVERPDPGWTGERGRLTPQMLESHLPSDHGGLHYFVCGPEPMMDVVEGHLRGRGIPAARIHSERFNIA